MKKLMVICSMVMTTTSLMAIEWKKADFSNEDDLRQIYGFNNNKLNNSQQNSTSSCWSCCCANDQKSPSKKEANFIKHAKDVHKKHPFKLDTRYDVHENDTDFLPTPGIAGTYLFYADKRSAPIGMINIDPVVDINDSFEKEIFELNMSSVFLKEADLKFRTDAISIIKQKFDNEVFGTNVQFYVDIDTRGNDPRIPPTVIHNAKEEMPTYNEEEIRLPTNKDYDPIDKLQATKGYISHLFIDPDLSKDGLLDAAAFYESGFVPSATESIHIEDEKDKKFYKVQMLYYPPFPDDKAMNWSPDPDFSSNEDSTNFILRGTPKEKRSSQDMDEIKDILEIIANGKTSNFDELYKKYRELCPKGESYPFPSSDEESNDEAEIQQSSGFFTSLFSCFGSGEPHEKTPLLKSSSDEE